MCVAYSIFWTLVLVTIVGVMPAGSAERAFLPRV